MTLKQVSIQARDYCRQLTRTLLSVCFACGVASCVASTNHAVDTTPLYHRLDDNGMAIDAGVAADIFSAYRHKFGLRELKPDPLLMAEAQRSALAAARADSHVSLKVLKKKLAAQNIQDTRVNMSAGYRTLAEAFSGWRQSPQHNEVLLYKAGKRFGIAAAYNSKSKYKVYWLLIVADM